MIITSNIKSKCSSIICFIDAVFTVTFISFIFFPLLIQAKDKIRVHVIPHSHDDVGWLRTMNNYYEDRPYCVRCILDNVYTGLKENKNRTFIYVEMAFFQKWFLTQSEIIKAEIREFVNEGRLDFANGGWVMNDEACAIKQDIIDQYRYGLNFLQREFGYQPRVAFSLDPFGHSKTNAAILSDLVFNIW